MEWLYCDLQEVGRHATTLTLPTDGVPIETLLNKKPEDGVTLALPQARPLSSNEIRLLTGKYLLYRQSFSGRSSSVIEIASIYQADPSPMQLRIFMYGHPSHDDLADYDPANRPKRTKERTEDYVGTLCCVGDMYSIICTHSGAHPLREQTEDSRVRYVTFPVVNVLRRHHYGLIMGYSPNRREPVAARIWAEKISDDPALADSDFDRVARGHPNEDDGVSIPDYVLSCIINQITPTELGVLSVDQARVPAAALGKKRTTPGTAADSTR
jgi:hypothetical protein